MGKWILCLAWVVGTAHGVQGQEEAGYILESCEDVLVVQPKRLLGMKGLKIPKVQELVGKLAERGRFDLRHIEQIIIAQGPGKDDEGKVINGAMRIVILRADQPFELKKVRQLYPYHQSEKVEGHDVYSGEEWLSSFCLLKPNLLLFTENANMPDVLKAGGKNQGILNRRLKAMNADQGIQLFYDLSSHRQSLPIDNDAPARSIEAMVQTCYQKVDQLELQVRYDTLAVELKLQCPTALAAQQTGGALNGLKGMGMALLEQKYDEVLKELPPEEQKKQLANKDANIEQLRGTLKLFQPQVQGTSVTAQLDGPTGTSLLTSTAEAIAIAMLSNLGTLKDRGLTSMHKLRQLGIGLLNYEGYQGYLRAFLADKNDKPLLSWRVAILPYIDQNDLYNEFHLDEPWDSEHNKKLISKMPYIFAAERGIAAEGKSIFVSLRGENTALNERKIITSNITDGRNNTVWLVEVEEDQAVIWTKPDDFQFDPKNPLKGLLKPNATTVTFGFADGSARPVPSNLAPEMYLRLFTINDGKEVKLPE